MAGGINLPQSIGVGPVVRAMDFEPMAQDPFTTMLKAYHTGMQGRGQGIENAFNAAQLPYAGPLAQAELDYKRASGQAAVMNAKVAKLNADLAAEKNPYEIQKIQYELKKAEREQKLDEFYAKHGIIGKDAQEYFGKQLTDQALPDQAAIQNMQQQLAQALGILPPSDSAPMPQVGGPMQAPAQPGMPMAEPAPEESTNPVMSIISDFFKRGGLTGAAKPGEAAQPALTQAMARTTPEDYLPKAKAGKSKFELNKQAFEEEQLPESNRQGLIEGKKEKAKAQVQRYTKLIEEADTQAESAGNDLNLFTQLRNTWTKIPEFQKGKAFGRVEPISGSALTFQTYLSSKVLEEMQKQHGVQTNQDREYIQGKFGNRKLTDKDFDELLTFGEITADRQIKRQQFFADNPDVPAEQLQKAWTAWSTEHPIVSDPAFEAFKLRQNISEKSPEELKDREDYLGWKATHEGTEADYKKWKAAQGGV